MGKERCGKGVLPRASVGSSLRTPGNQKVLLEASLNLERIGVVGFFLTAKPQATRTRDEIPPRPRPAALTQPGGNRPTWGGGWGRRERATRGAMTGSLGLVLRCEAENLRGRAILEVKSGLAF